MKHIKIVLFENQDIRIGYSYIMLKTITVKKLFSAVLLAGMSLGAQAGTYTQYVNTAIGTGGHGHVFYGANVPFGLV